MASSTDLDGVPVDRPLILITRPVEDAAGLVDALRAEGFNALVEPMLRIEPLAGAMVDLTGCRAILFTSANGVRAFARVSAVRSLPVVTVGTASAQAATEAGFEDIEASGGDVDALIETVRTRFPIEGGAFFHAAGSVTAGDLKGGLEAHGYTVRRVPLYQSVKVDSFSDACRAALDTGRVSGVAFFSPRTAESFVTVLRGEGRAPCARTVWAFCLSGAVARAAAGPEWLGVKQAETPDTPVLIAQIKALFGTGNQLGRMTMMADDKKNDDGVEEKGAPESGSATPQAATEAKSQTDAESQTEVETTLDVAEAVSEFDTDAVIDAFGGIRPMASKLDVAVSTVQGWKNRGHIPENRWRDIITAASVHSIDLSVAMPADKRPESSEPTTSPWGDDAADAEPESQDDAGIDDEDRPDASAPAARDSAPAQVSSGSGGGGKLAVLIAVASLAAVVARPVWAPYVDPYLAKYVQPSASVGSDEVSSDLKAELAAFSDRLSQVEARPVATGDGAVIPGDLASRLDALEKDVESLSDVAESLQAIRDETASALKETRSALAASVERDETSRARLLERMGVIESMLEQVSKEAERATAGLAGIDSQAAKNAADIADLKARPALEGAAQAGLALAVGDVESALSAGRPFKSALDRLSGLARDNAAIDSAVADLQPYAAAGVATRAALIADFQRHAPAMQAELDRTDGDVLDVLLQGARSLVSIRKKGEAPDAPPVSRAEAALNRGDLASAVAALSPGRDASNTVAAWLTAAEARLAAEAALTNLRDAVAAGLAIVPSPAAQPEPEAAKSGDPS
jgi:uroporphyrinogen-III synthase